MHRNSAAASHSIAKRNFTVTIRNGDRFLVAARGHGNSLEVVDTFAVMKAAMRDAFDLCHDTRQVLENCIAGVPKALVHDWMREELKRAA